MGDFDTHVILYKKWIISCDFRANELAQYAAGQVLWAIRPTFISSAVSSCLLDLSSGIPETLPLFTNEDRRPPFSSLDFLLLFILVFLGRCFREVGNENVKLVIYGYNFSSFSGRAGSFLRSPFLSIPALSRALEWLSPLALILCSRAEIVLCPGWSWGGVTKKWLGIWWHFLDFWEKGTFFELRCGNNWLFSTHLFISELDTCATIETARTEAQFSPRCWWHNTGFRDWRERNLEEKRRRERDFWGESFFSLFYYIFIAGVHCGISTYAYRRC